MFSLRVNKKVFLAVAKGRFGRVEKKASLVPFPFRLISLASYSREKQPASSLMLILYELIEVSILNFEYLVTYLVYMATFGIIDSRLNRRDKRL